MRALSFRSKEKKLICCNLNSAIKEKVCCFYTKASSEESMLWHIKLSHLNFKAINSLVKREMLRDIPTLEIKQEEVCEACQKGKMKRSSHKTKEFSSIITSLQLIHMDIFGSCKCNVSFQEEVCFSDGG